MRFNFCISRKSTLINAVKHCVALVAHGPRRRVSPLRHCQHESLESRTLLTFDFGLDLRPEMRISGEQSVLATQPQLSDGTVDSSKSKEISSGVNGGPVLTNLDYFGTSVASLGDLDGDGVTDLVVGAMGDDTGGPSRGAIYVQFMNSNGTVKGSSKIADNLGGFTNLATNGRFGSAVTSLGDFDGDGRPDIAVGAMLNPGAEFGLPPGGLHVLMLDSMGRVIGNRLVTHGIGGGPTLAGLDYFGCSVASLGDMDGDGVTDLAVGAYGDDTGGTDRGAVYVLFLKSDGTVKNSVKIASGTNGGPTLSNNDLFGNSMASLGDLDGDGVTDLAVGAEGDDSGGTYRGAVHVLLLNANGTVKSHLKIASSSNGGPALANLDYFGSSIASLGDLDGDGVVDLAVGAAFDDTKGSARGAVLVLFLNLNGSVKSTLKLASSTNGGPSLSNHDAFGTSVASLGDLDGDGVTDLAVGAWGDDSGGTERGAVHVLFLNSFGTIPLNLAITPDATTTNVNPISFTFQFNKTVTGFEIDDVLVTNGLKGEFTALDGDTYTLVVTPVAEGDVTVSVPANVALDADSNGNSAVDATVHYSQTIVLLDLGGPPVTWIKKAPPVKVLPQLLVANGFNLAGGSLGLSLSTIGTKRKSLDQLRIPSVTFGTSLQESRTPALTTVAIQLSDDDATSLIQLFLRGITFATKGKGFKILTRKLNVTLTDADGQSTTVSQTINVRKMAESTRSVVRRSGGSRHRVRT